MTDPKPEHGMSDPNSIYQESMAIALRRALRQAGSYAAGHADGRAEALAEVLAVVENMGARRRKRFDALLVQGTRQESVIRSLDGELHVLHLLLTKLRKLGKRQ